MPATTKIILQIAVSLGIMAAFTAVLSHVTVIPAHSDHFVYLYLLPVALIAILFSGRLAVLGAGVAIACSAYFLQAPVYSFYVNNPLERIDLVWFAVLSALSIKCIHILIRPARISRTK